jgi:antitoxin MazE
MSMIKIGPKHQITIPKTIFASLGLEAGDYVETIVEDGTIRLVPQKLVPKDQAWFWTKEWQKGEAEADEDIANDRLSKPLKTARALLKHLG